MPQPSNRERAREILAAHQRPCDKSASGYVGLHMASFRLLLPEIAAAIDAAVEEEREACAVICEDFVQVVGGTLTARQHWYKIAAKRVAAKIRARGGDRE